MAEAKITKKEMVQLSSSQVEHLKKLARVEFGEKETEDLAGDLAGILGFVEQLKEIDVGGAEEVYAGAQKNIFRADENPLEFNEKLLGNLIGAFPEKEKTYLKVKAVIKK